MATFLVLFLTRADSPIHAQMTAQRDLSMVDRTGQSLGRPLGLPLRIRPKAERLESDAGAASRTIGYCVITAVDLTDAIASMEAHPHHEVGEIQILQVLDPALITG